MRRKTALKHAAGLVSDTGENKEYDRALTEMVIAMTSFQPDDREIVDAKIRAYYETGRY